LNTTALEYRLHSCWITDGHRVGLIQERSAAVCEEIKQPFRAAETATSSGC